MDIIERTFAPANAAALVRKGVPALLARLLAARGVTAAQAQLSLAGLHHYETLRHCADMARVLADAIEHGNRLLIVSDYDADGATACAVGLRCLRAFGANVGYLVPRRLEHGYGLTPDIARIASELQPKPDTIITVDNGISSHDGIAEANRLGMRVLVTDHHLAPSVLPPAQLIVNPNQPGCEFASKSIAGVGVMWYVMWALQDELQRRGRGALEPDFDVAQVLPAVAVGTIADVVALDYNNRILVHEGLRRIRDGRSLVGIDALASAAGRNPRQMSCTDIAFGVGPRINAAGRLESMDAGVECLTTDQLPRAVELAMRLSDINNRRRDIEAAMVEQAVGKVAALHADDGRFTVVVHDDGWHQGVIGIVAGRLRELLNRPVFVFASAKDGELRGSGRSITGFHLRDALDLVNKRSPGVLAKFGGHAMAAGVTLAAGALSEFATAFEAVAHELLTPAMLRRCIETDGALDTADMTLESALQIKQGVWGQGFPEPLFCDTFEVLEERRIGANNAHRRLVVRKNGRTYSGVQFRAAGQCPPLARLAYRLEPNEFRENVTLQLLVEAVLPA